MSESIIVSGVTKREKYESLIPQVKALVEGEQDFIANVSNIIAAGAYELAVEYSKVRKAFGTEISNHQIIQFKLADMATEIEVRVCEEDLRDLS